MDESSRVILRYVIVLSKNMELPGLAKAYDKWIEPLLKTAIEQNNQEAQARLRYAAQRVTYDLQLID